VFIIGEDQDKNARKETVNMDPLIITMTSDSTMCWPRNPHCPKPSDSKAVAEEYIRAAQAGMAIAHTHGSYEIETKIQPDGRQLQVPIMEGWRDIIERIRAAGKPILQTGLASIRIEQKVEMWKEFRPEMTSINFNSHDEFFQPYHDAPPIACYSVHPINELREYARLARDNEVKLEIECFTTGGFWAINKLREGNFFNDDGTPEHEEGLLPDPLWIELLFGWTGQGWTPPTSRALNYMVDHLPPRSNYHVSCLDPEAYWPLLTHAIAKGGHVRVGMEDCPYLEPGKLAMTNAQLVEKAVNIARAMGREIASPDEARQIIGLAK
jgi:3-keto-5-aminohexanoate cleavage enzyme